MERWQNSLQEQTLQLSLKQEQSPTTTRKIRSLLCPALLFIIPIEVIKTKPFILCNFPNYKTGKSKTASSNCIVIDTLPFPLHMTPDHTWFHISEYIHLRRVSLDFNCHKTTPKIR